MTSVVFSNGHATVKGAVIPASPPNFDALKKAALALPDGVEAYKALFAIRYGHTEHIIPAGGKPSARAQKLQAALKPDAEINGQLAKYELFAEYCAVNITPNYVQAVKEYNQGIPTSQPWFDPLFARINEYQKQGGGARGRLTPETGSATIKQWIQDRYPGGFEKWGQVALVVVSTALAAYFGGLVGGQFISAFAKTAVQQQIADAQSSGQNMPPPPKQGAPAAGLPPAANGQDTAQKNTALDAEILVGGVAAFIAIPLLPP